MSWPIRSKVSDLARQPGLARSTVAMLEMLMLISGADMIKDLVARVARVRCRCSFIVSCIILSVIWWLSQLHVSAVWRQCQLRDFIVKHVISLSVLWNCQYVMTQSVAWCHSQLCDGTVSYGISLSNMLSHCQFYETVSMWWLMMSLSAV